MKICFVDKIFFPFIGGAEIVVYEVAKRLIRQGHEVHVLTGQISDDRPYEEIEGMKIHRIKMPVSARSESLGRPAFVFFSVLPLRNLIKKEKFDIVVENIAPNPSFTPLVSSIMGVPCVGLIHDIPEWSKLGYSPLVSFLNGSQISLFLRLMPYRGFIVVSDESHRKLRLITKKGGQMVIHNGVDYESMDSVKVSRKFERPTVIYIGRFSKNKRLDWLLEATAKLRSEYPDINTIIVGTGTKNLEDGLLRLSNALKLENNVEFAGKVSERKKIELLKKSHLLVLPSTTEGCPLVLIEAMAASVPVVASNVGGIPEIVRDSGLLVDGGGDEFAAAISKLMGDDRLRRRMGKAGRKLVEEKLSWGNVTGEHLKFYLSFIAK